MTTKTWLARPTNNHVGTAAPVRPVEQSSTVRGPRILAGLLLGVAFASAAAMAQTCENWSPEQRADSIAQIQRSCDHNQMPYTADVYALASIGDKQAIPALHKLADWPTDKDGGAVCQAWVRAARVALAKLGNDEYRAGLQKQDIAFIGYRRRSGVDGAD